MGIYKKGFCAIISILLCSILITSTTISGTFAKFTVNDSSDDSARVSKWGIELSSSTGLNHTYENDDIIYVTSEGTIGGEIIAPGTKGVLAELTVSGKPEVAYHINVDGTFLTGDAYHTQPHTGATAEELKKCPNVCPGLLRMPDGTKLGYLPMIFKLYKTVDGTKTLVRMYRVSGGASCDSKVIDYVNGSGVTMAQEITNDISSKFDETKNPNFDVNITYTLEWEWLYTPTGNTAITYEGFTNFTHTHQTSERDTALGVSLHKHKDLLKDDSRRCKITGLAPFDITASITLTVSQVD